MTPKRAYKEAELLVASDSEDAEAPSAEVRATLGFEFSEPEFREPRHGDRSPRRLPAPFGHGRAMMWRVHVQRDLTCEWETVYGPTRWRCAAWAFAFYWWFMFNNGWSALAIQDKDETS